METVHTIGHGSEDIDSFICRLKQYKINLLIDVRRKPGSKQFPVFNQAPLKSMVEKNGIDYYFLGDLIGGNPNYSRYMETDDFKQGFYILRKVIKDRVPAIMCSEFDYQKCHRRFISSKLKEAGFGVKHIKKDGSIATQENTLLSYTSDGDDSP